MEAAATGVGGMLREILPFAVAGVLLLLLAEQLVYLRKKGPLNGPPLVVPFFGSVAAMIRNPTRFWEEQAARAKASGLGISADYLFGRFIVFIRDTALSHEVFGNVRPDAFHLIGHPFGKKLFGEHNLIYMFDQYHRDLRRRLAPNFTPRALATYSALQQGVIAKHLRLWLAAAEASPGRPVKLRVPFREMNLETSQNVFAGPYLMPESRRRFKEDYNLFNVGVMALPVDLPGFAFRRARFAVARLVETLSGAAKKSKVLMRAGEEPKCLIDFWMQETVRELDEAEAAGAPPPPETGDDQIGGHIFDFLFASQDASTSSLCWAVALLDSHPHVLERLRSEISGVWSLDSGEPITSEQLASLRYAQAVAREVLRIKAPATLVPHVAGEAFKITDWYTIPKGAIVFPSTYESSFQGFPDAGKFDPDRFMDPRNEDQVYKKYFLVFGAGAHQCVGQRYAINHLVLFLVLFVSAFDFRRHNSDGRDEPVYLPTIAPKDDCAVLLTRRCARMPEF